MKVIQLGNERRVQGVGPQSAKIALVGEAPGREEAVRGVPFVGAAGKNLDQMLASAGIIRSMCYITNVVKERPPANDISHFINLSKKPPLMTKEYLRYEEELREELMKVRPNVVVALGAVPLWALCRKLGIVKWRGSILSSTLIEGMKVIPTIHPSAALRQYIFSHMIVYDLLRAKDEMETPKISLPKRHLRTCPTFTEAMRFIQLCESQEVVAYDIEVVGGELLCISFAINPNQAISITFTAKGSQYFTPQEEVELMEAIARLLSNEKVVKVGHNLIFDSSFLARKYGIFTKNIEDTMIAQGILAPELPKGLDFITSVYTKEPYYKDEGKQYLKLFGSEDDFWIYNAKDSAVTLECWGKLLPLLKKQGNLETYEAQRDLIHPLTCIMERGIKVDVEGMERAKVESERIEAEAVEELRKICGFEINPASARQLKEYFYITKGIKPYVSRTTGRYTIDEKALKRIARKGFKEAELILKIRKQAKLRSTYLSVKLGEDGRVRCSFNPVGTKTGRLSSSKDIFGYGTNIQNWSDEAIQYMIADEGYALYTIDLSQAENRVTAYIAPEMRMIKNFEEGVDTHAYTASMISGLSIEQVIEEDKKGIPCDIGNGTHTWRYWGKKANHSFDYGEGYRTFAFYSEISEGEAKVIWTQWHRIYPGIQQYWSWVREQLRRTRSLTNCLGRKTVFFERWGDSLFKQAYSFIPQSTIADIINRRGILFIYRNEEFHKVELLNQVHDSIVFQIPLSLGWKFHAEVVNRVVESLEQKISWRGQSFVIPAEVKVGVRLGRSMVKVKSKPVKWTDLKKAFDTLEGRVNV